jgi:hypothetical protein
MNGIIPDIVLQVSNLSRDENSLAGCNHLADTKTLNASKQHYHKKSTYFGFAPGDATTFKSILNEYGKDVEVLGLVLGYSGEASSDVYRVADLVVT